jgi:hypothetical protein
LRANLARLRTEHLPVRQRELAGYLVYDTDVVGQAGLVDLLQPGRWTGE